MAARPRLSDFAMPLGQHVRRGHISYGRLQFVLPAGNDVALALHHRVEAGLGDLRRVVLLLLPDRGVKHVGPREELGLGRTGIRQVTVTPVFCNSFRSANEKELMNALVPL